MLSLVVPPVAQNGLFTVISSLFGASIEEFAISGPNSQTVALLKAPLSPNPSIGGGEVVIVDESAIMSELTSSGNSGSDTVTSSGQISLYVVRTGDSISQIAKMFGVSVNTIVWGNDLSGGIIKEGQMLVILPITGVQHTIKSGDTIDSIAKKYKSDAQEVRQFNNLSVSTKLVIGETIIIPDGEIAPSVKVPKVSGKSKTAPDSFYGVSKNPLPVQEVNDGFYARPLVGGKKTQGIHGYNAVDIAAPVGTPLLASADGTVIISKSTGWNGGYGMYVVISHSNGTQTLYAHMSSIIVSVGTNVVKGRVIGSVGSTGKSTGPHVHFEIRGARNPF